MVTRGWHRKNVLAMFAILLWLSGCLETEQAVPFDPGAFETSTPDEAVVITVAGDSFVQGEPVPYTITNSSARTVYYGFKGGGICELPPTGVVTFLYAGDTESGWKRVHVHAPNPDFTEEEPTIGELAAGEAVECSWDQIGHQEPELEGEERFTGWGAKAPVPPGYYQFRFYYAFDDDWYPAAEVSYSDIFEIE